MTIIEKLNTIQRRILSTAASVANYETWSDEFSRKEVKAACSSETAFGFPEIEKIAISEFQDLDRETLYNYGFGNWDNKLILLPLYLVNFIDDDPILTCISGAEYKLSECDKDVRFGCLAYGFYME